MPFCFHSFYFSDSNYLLVSNGDYNNLYVIKSVFYFNHRFCYKNITLVNVRQTQDPVTVDWQFDGVTPSRIKNWSVRARYDARGDGDVDGGLGGDHVHPHQLSHKRSGRCYKK